MAKYIDKDAVVAEVEKIREHVIRLRYAVDANCIVTIRNACECLETSIDVLVNSIDTLEVKEVDLDNYVHGTIDYPIIGNDFPNIYPNYRELKDYCDKNRIMDNNKVRLIIVKEDM